MGKHSGNLMAQELLDSKEINNILKCVQNGSTLDVKELLSKYPHIHWSSIQYDKTGDTILHCAARLGNNQLIKFLLQNFQPTAVDCKNRDDKTALHEAAQFGQYETCKLLLECGADVNALKRADWTPIMLACTKINGLENYNIIETFLKYDVCVNHRNKDGWTCFHLICREGDVGILELLLKSGLDPHVTTKNGRTGLHIASLHGHLKIVEVLLTLNIDVNTRDNSCNTPLHEAVLGGHINICERLIQAGAIVTHRTNGDYTSLHLASLQGHVEIIKFLLNYLDINESNNSGLSPLHCAAKNKRKEAYDVLIQYGANENFVDHFGRKASDYMALK
uniref:Ankyrin repeat domain-containing protein 16-like n=1 Tax=Diabrotica virgifera virgifera TaxID=50390 RepID=A0A6P7FZT2_DIAVI